MTYQDIFKKIEAGENLDYWKGYLAGYNGEEFDFLLIYSTDKKSRDFAKGYTAGLGRQSQKKGQPKKFKESERVSFHLPEEIAKKCPRNKNGKIDPDFIRKSLYNSVSEKLFINSHNSS